MHQVFFLQHVGDAHLVDAGTRGGVESRGGSHHHRATLVAEFLETPATEPLGIVDWQLGHGVESTHGNGGINAGYAVQSVDEAFAALHIFVVHLTVVFFGSVQRRLGHYLADEGWRQTGLAEFHHRGAHGSILRDECADADATFAVTLRHGVDENDVLFDAFQMACADIGRAGVDIFAVHLVGEEIQVIFLHQVTYLVHLATGVEITRGVVGVANHDGAGALVDQLLEFLHLGQRETLVDGGGDGAYLRAGADGEGHVVGVSGLGHDNLVAGVQATEESEEHCLAAARSNDDIVGGDVDIILRVITHQFLAVAQVALRGRIFQNVAVDALQCRQPFSWGRQVGLANVQMIDLCTALLGCHGQRSELAYGRFGHLYAAKGYVWHFYLEVRVGAKVIIFRVIRVIWRSFLEFRRTSSLSSPHCGPCCTRRGDPLRGSRRHISGGSGDSGRHGRSSWCRRRSPRPISSLSP